VSDAILFPGDTDTLIATADGYDCLGLPYGTSPDLINCSSDNPSVVTVDSYCNYTAIAPGQAVISGSAQIGYYDCSTPPDGFPPCPFTPTPWAVASTITVTDFTLSGPINCMDGDTSTLSVNITSGQARGYQ